MWTKNWPAGPEGRRAYRKGFAEDLPGSGEATNLATSASKQTTTISSLTGSCPVSRRLEKGNGQECLRSHS